MSRFYTRKGDDGTTGLIGNRRLPKDDPIFSALGTLDEASAALGMARAFSESEATRTILAQTQRDLYLMMAELAGAEPGGSATFTGLPAGQLAWLEQQVDEISSRLPALREFILPGDTRAGAALALARTVVRRAERAIAALVTAGSLNGKVTLPYLNRLSTLCFVLELDANRNARQETSTARSSDPEQA